MFALFIKTEHLIKQPSSKLFTIEYMENWKKRFLIHMSKCQMAILWLLGESWGLDKFNHHSQVCIHMFLSGTENF